MPKNKGSRTRNQSYGTTRTGGRINSAGGVVRGTSNNRVRTAQSRQGQTRSQMSTMAGIRGDRALVSGLNRSGAASQGVGAFPGQRGSNRQRRPLTFTPRPTPRPRSR